MSYKTRLEGLVEYLVKEGGSDLHLAEGRKPIIRVHGDLLPVPKYEAQKEEDITGFLKEMLTAEDVALFEEELHVDFSYSPDGKIRFRGNAFIQQRQKSVALRLIPQQIQSFEELRLPPTLESFTRRKQGFFLVVGPTGHGKSTTLATMIDLINENRTEHITTIEDPIEFVFEPKKSMIDQREVRADTRSFHSALLAAFRQDIDVLMVGEMRTPETMATAVTAAETGHLVFSTLHTNTAAQTIERIIDTFDSQQQDQIRMQLASSLSGIFSQRLLPRISGGRIPAYELLVGNNAVSNLIREKRTHEIDTIIETSSEEGMITLNRSLADLVKDGEISIETAFAYTPNYRSLERLL